MAAEIRPGQWISVKVTAEPKKEAGRKTMVRLFRKDLAVTTEHRRLQRCRPHRPTRRGGRIWMNRSRRIKVVKTTPGATYRIFATIDALRGLKSLDGCVEATPAS